jgi:hypothetical protein
MEQVIIQDCGCIALPESVATALDLRRGMALDVALNDSRDAILLTPHHDSQALEDMPAQPVPTSGCVILPPSR